MTARSIREALRAQLVDTQRMLGLVAGHPLMEVAFQNRESELLRKIEGIPEGSKEAKTILFFSGEPVCGSIGIDASFASRVMEPFQSMVMADYADRYHGVVGKRGRRAGEAMSRLLLTGLPRGSVGLELTRAESDEIFEEDQLADTLSHVVHLIESAGTSDEVFMNEMNDTAPRVIQNLRDFLNVVSKGNAGLRVESGDQQCVLDPIRAKEAADRVSSTITSTEEIRPVGVFSGALLNSWRFDFMSASGHVIRGKIDDSLTSDEVVELNKEFFNERCRAKIEKTRVLFRNGNERTSYVLLGLETLGNEDEALAD